MKAYHKKSAHQGLLNKQQQKEETTDIGYGSPTTSFNFLLEVAENISPGNLLKISGTYTRLAVPYRIVHQGTVKCGLNNLEKHVKF